MRGFCRDLVVNFAVDFSGLRLKGRKALRNPRKNHTKVHDKIHALRMRIHHDECSAEGQS